MCAGLFPTLTVISVFGYPSKNFVAAGQAVVQIVQDRVSRMEFAMKFFLSHRAFDKESRLYMDRTQPLGQYLPDLRTIVDQKDGYIVTDAFGRLLPPCIVMEKGEALDLWIQKAGFLDMFTGLQVRNTESQDCSCIRGKFHCRSLQHQVHIGGPLSCTVISIYSYPDTMTVGLSVKRYIFLMVLPTSSCHKARMCSKS